MYQERYTCTTFFLLPKIVGCGGNLYLTSSCIRSDSSKFLANIEWFKDSADIPFTDMIRSPTQSTSLLWAQLPVMYKCIYIWIIDVIVIHMPKFSLKNIAKIIRVKPRFWNTSWSAANPFQNCQKDWKMAWVILFYAKIFWTVRFLKEFWQKHIKL